MVCGVYWRALSRPQECAGLPRHTTLFVLFRINGQSPPGFGSLINFSDNSADNVRYGAVRGYNVAHSAGGSTRY